ncbi:MAG: sigma-70 family RNA polymerase sigma factor [Bacteroidales bacterium]|nr:sigma-70 family RNA polymerase sigma factor [Bacteroidales bacterium]
MEEIKSIYVLLLHSTGLKIKEIARKLNLDKYYVAKVMYSVDNISYWYQDSSSLWFAIEGAIYLDESKEDPLIAPLAEPKRYNFERYLQDFISDSLRAYVLNLSRYRLYSNEEIVELFRRYKNGDRNAYDLIVKSQQKLVVGIAYLYRKDGVLFEDLIQEGNLGLLKAIEHFDDSQNFSFYNYAKYWIRQAIAYSMTYLPFLIRLPINQQISYRKIQQFKEKFEQLTGFSPSVNDVELDESLDGEKLSFLFQLPDNLKDIVCIEELDDYESDLPCTPEKELIYQSLQIEVERSLSTLKLREVDVIRCYFGLRGCVSMTLDEIGKKYDLTRERVRQIKDRAIRKLYHTSRSRNLMDYLN